MLLATTCEGSLQNGTKLRRRTLGGKVRWSSSMGQDPLRCVCVCGGGSMLIVTCQQSVMLAHRCSRSWPDSLWIFFLLSRDGDLWSGHFSKYSQDLTPTCIPSNWQNQVMQILKHHKRWMDWSLFSDCRKNVVRLWQKLQSRTETTCDDFLPVPASQPCSLTKSWEGLGLMPRGVNVLWYWGKPLGNKEGKSQGKSKHSIRIKGGVTGQASCTQRLLWEIGVILGMQKEILTLVTLWFLWKIWSFLFTYINLGTRTHWGRVNDQGEINFQTIHFSCAAGEFRKEGTDWLEVG